MSELLVALLGYHLCALDKHVTQSIDYQRQTVQRDACIKNWLEKVGEDKRPFCEMLLALSEKNQELIAKDVFMRGFTLGALTTIEAHVNQEKYIVLGKDAPNPPANCADEHDPCERHYIKLITQELMEARVRAITTHPDDARFLELEAEREDSLKAAALQANLDESDAVELENQLFPINARILRLKNKHRFPYGYSLGMFLIGDVFDFREKLLT